MSGYLELPCGIYVLVGGPVEQSDGSYRNLQWRGGKKGFFLLFQTEPFDMSLFKHLEDA